MPVPDTAPLTVLFSHRLEGPILERIAGDFPGVRFAVTADDGTVPEDARTAHVLFRAGMSHEALRVVLDQAPSLQWIHTASAGFNWVLIPEVVASDVRLTRTAGALDVPIAEFVLATTLALVKRLPGFLTVQRKSTWLRDLGVERLAGKTVGIIGAGAIGSATARRFRSFDTHVLGLKRTPVQLPDFDEVLGPDGLDRLIHDSDVLVLACPLTPETEHMLNARTFERMKPTSLLINVSRGAVVVEEDLIEALSKGEIAAAALDVFDTEPLPQSSPLWGMENVIVTPHASYLGPGSEEATAEEFAENLRRFLAGEPLCNEIKSRALGY